MCTQGSAKPEPKASPVDVATTDMMKKYNVRVAKFLDLSLTLHLGAQ